jgi:hypothetical protein
LQIDDGVGGPFISVGGYNINSLLTYYTITTGIIRGRTYRLRYRALNGAGWSSFSPILFALAATVP